VRIAIIIISGSRRRDKNFVDEFHAQRRGIRGQSWASWLFEGADWRVRGRREGTNRWRRGIWKYSRNHYRMEGIGNFIKGKCRRTRRQENLIWRKKK